MVSVEKKNTWYKSGAIALIFTSIALFLLWTFVYLNDAYIQNQFSNHDTTLTLIRHNFKNYLDHQKSIVQKLASNEQIIQFCAEKSADSSAIMPIVQGAGLDTLIFDAQYNKLFAQGNQIEHYNNETLRQSMQRSLFLAMPDVIDIIELTTSPEFTVLVSTPIFQKTKLVGFITLKLDTSKIANVLMYPYITDAQNVTITRMVQDKLITVIPHDTTFSIAHHTDTSRIKSGIYKQATRGQSGTLHVDRTMLTWHYMPEMNWGITLETAQANPNSLLITIKIVLLFCIVLSIIGAAYYSYRTWRTIPHTITWDSLLIPGARVGLYALFVVNIVTAVLFSAAYYRTVHIDKQKHALQQSIALHTAVQKQTTNTQTTSVPKLSLFIVGMVLIVCTIVLTSYSIIFYAYSDANKKRRLLFCLILSLVLTITKLFIAV